MRDRTRACDHEANDELARKPGLTLQSALVTVRELTAVLRQPKRLALLLYLTLASPRGLQRRDRLLALFWPEQEESRARNALSQALHVLRRGLGEEVLVRRGEMPARVVVTPRIGLSRAADWPLRFVDAGTRFASRPLPTYPRARGRG